MDLTEGFLVLVQEQEVVVVVGRVRFGQQVVVRAVVALRVLLAGVFALRWEVMDVQCGAAINRSLY